MLMDAFKNLMYLVIAVALLWAVWGDDVRQIRSRGQPAEYVQARDLLNHYTDNQIAADQRYKGKRVRTSGKISVISRDLLGDAYVILDAPGLFGVQCYTSDNVAAQLNRGDMVTVNGMVDGKFGNVMLRDCRVIKR